MKTILAALLTLATVAPAAAQYYERPPPPPPGYYERGYNAPPRYRARFGRRCDTVMETRFGARQVICPIVEAKPVGAPCACPAPRGRGGFVGGNTIR